MGLNLIPWAIAGFFALFAFGYVVHAEKVKREHASFVAEIRSQAKEQERRNKDRADKEKHAKEQADAKVKNDRTNLLHTIQRLRDERARASSVPTAPANASRADLACFDRAELARAVDNLEAGVEELVREGAEATIDLDGAKGWALKLSTELKSGS